MRVVAAENRQLARKELEFGERALERRIVRMAFDVAIESCRLEVSADQVALELGHVDAVGGEAAERLVQRGRNALDAKDERGQYLPLAPVGVEWPGRKHDEPRGVVLGVFDVLAQRLETVDLAGQRRSDRRARHVAR